MKCSRCNALLHYGRGGILLNRKGRICKKGRQHVLHTFLVDSDECAEYQSAQQRIIKLRRQVEALQIQSAYISATMPDDTDWHWWHSVIFCCIQSYYVENYDDDAVSISYGDLENCFESEATYVRVPYTGYSDYSGGSVERSNYRSLLREFPGVFVETYGGHGTRELLFPLAYRGENREEILDIMKGLQENYALYDEDDESMLVMDEAMDSWDTFIKFDLYRDLPEMCESPEVMADMLEAMDEETVKQMFYDITGEQNEYPYWENGSSGVHFPCYKDTAEVMYERLWAQRLNSANYQLPGQEMLLPECYYEMGQ